MTTGDKIKFLRNKKGLSQEELGAMVGVKKAAINKYENGIVINLKRTIIAKLAIALETTPTYLLGFEDDNAPTSIEENERAERVKIISDKLSQLSDEHLAIALAQLEVLIEHQERKNNA